ncbi:MAG: Redoxin domain protein [Chthonomonadaceae bacterium]|nr:Redoxin domain protein [Chthonomonadaceae bacterium]
MGRFHYRLGVVGTTLALCVAGQTGQAQKRYDPGKNALSRPVQKPGPETPDRSHSMLGGAFDQGPRQQARLMKGIGNVHFPVTTSRPEAQKFFDQGINYLYSFSWFESERSFRTAAKIDQDCAMAYWGMAMADSTRGKEFLKFAQDRESKVTDRERRYIDSLAITFRDGDAKKNTTDNIHALEALVHAYPDDVEAKAMLAWVLREEQSGSSFRVAIDALLREVLAKNPLHPAAHHYRIHMWDGDNAEEALDSSIAYAKAAPGIGHALHMPGHIYARLGMFVKATESMEAATRLERRYCADVGEMPFETWDFLHNQDFLCGAIGYTGRIHDGVRLAIEMRDTPYDPQFNPGYSFQRGRFNLLRARVRGECWDEILNDKQHGWTDSDDDRLWLYYSQGLAALGKGDLVTARRMGADLAKLKLEVDQHNAARLEMRGRLAVQDGKAAEGIDMLKKALEMENKSFQHGDPINYPRPVYESLAWAYLTTKQPGEAEAVLRTGLRREPENGFGIAMLTEALVAEGRRSEALEQYTKLAEVWQHADSDLPALLRVKALNLESDPACSVRSPFPTPYIPSAEMQRYGPMEWQPFPAPDVVLTNRDGKPTRLSAFRGHNTLLVFYLGGACPACTLQLNALGKEKAALTALDTEIAAVSSDTPQANQAFLTANSAYPLRLFSDVKHDAAKRCKAFDDFEGKELHATLLLDKHGRVWWYRYGVEPFTDNKFLKEEIARMNAWEARHPFH